ncbi:hypothetical protein KY289_035381 [Solanum tuberosum]|nr:hypothetical protein KY289_035381 [Solanum tuberosum]
MIEEGSASILKASSIPFSPSGYLSENSYPLYCAWLNYYGVGQLWENLLMNCYNTTIDTWPEDVRPMLNWDKGKAVETVSITNPN